MKNDWGTVILLGIFVAGFLIGRFGGQCVPL